MISNELFSALAPSDLAEVHTMGHARRKREFPPAGRIVHLPVADNAVVSRFNWRRVRYKTTLASLYGAAGTFAVAAIYWFTRAAQIH